MPTPRAGAAVAVLGKQILVVGGVGEDQSPLKMVEMYNTEEGKWRKRSTLREALMGVSITVKGTHYFIFKNCHCCSKAEQTHSLNNVPCSPTPRDAVVCAKQTNNTSVG